MIRQNRAVPILLVLTFAFILYLGGCFGSEDSTSVAQESATPVPTPSPGPVVDPGITPEAAEEEPFFHTVEPGDLLASIASKYNVPADVIIRANPDLDVNLILVGQQLRIPGASTNSELLENVGPDRADNVVATYLIEPGDTLGEIADTWTVTVDALQAANPDVDPANLQVCLLYTSDAADE